MSDRDAAPAYDYHLFLRNEGVDAARDAVARLRQVPADEPAVIVLNGATEHLAMPGARVMSAGEAIEALEGALGGT